MEAAGCIPDPPGTGYLGRYGFISVQDLFSWLMKLCTVVNFY
jgi:hypothetical protein